MSEAELHLREVAAILRDLEEQLPYLPGTNRASALATLNGALDSIVRIVRILTQQPANEAA